LTEDCLFLSPPALVRDSEQCCRISLLLSFDLAPRRGYLLFPETAVWTNAGASLTDHPNRRDLLSPRGSPLQTKIGQLREVLFLIFWRRSSNLFPSTLMLLLIASPPPKFSFLSISSNLLSSISVPGLRRDRFREVSVFFLLQSDDYSTFPLTAWSQSPPSLRQEIVPILLTPSEPLFQRSAARVQLEYSLPSGAVSSQ